MATTYIDYDAATPVGQMLSELAGHLAAATGLATRTKKAILAMNDDPATLATTIEAKLGLRAGQGNLLYQAIGNTEEDLINCNVWQTIDQGLIL